MGKRPGTDIPEHQVTDERLYLDRRRFLRTSAAAFAGLVAGVACEADGSETVPSSDATAPRMTGGPYSTDEPPNSYKDITTYNNFYEFGTGKADPHRHAGSLVTSPWSVTVDGECDKPGVYAYEDIVGPHSPEERIYRLRCVEAWSMVIPWLGIPLAAMLKRFEPNSRAKYVRFETLHDPQQMPGQKRRVLDWPYVEGLSIAEAMNPLTLMATGLYGRELPNQNGAPLRLVVPWKYGFKSIKSIVRIEFVARRPRTSWEIAAPHEYGFYANVNPEVDHPRWSQARERRIGAGLFADKQPTRLFNGYGEHVAHLYAGLDLSKNF